MRRENRTAARGKKILTTCSERRIGIVMKAVMKKKVISLGDKNSNKCKKFMQELGKRGEWDQGNVVLVLTRGLPSPCHGCHDLPILSSGRPLRARCLPQNFVPDEGACLPIKCGLAYTYDRQSPNPRTAQRYPQQSL